MRLDNWTFAKFVLLVFCFCFVSAQVYVNKTTNGYSGIVIAFDENPKTQLVINNVKELLTNASERMYHATGLFLDEVTILLPYASHNTVETDGFATGPTIYDLADVRVVSSSKGPPYAVQRGDCGEPGDFIHISSEYISNISSVEKLGDPGKSFLGLWAQYRYGLFDESELGRFYYDPDEQLYRASYCSNKVANGSLVNSITKLECAIDEFGFPLEKCFFVVKSGRNDGMESSLLFDATLPHMTRFCNESTHNRYAPTMQNLRCDGRSAWEVMKRHEDFQNLSSNPRFSSPRFQVLTSKPSDKIAFVIDLNIVKDKAIAKAVLASLTKYILYAIPNGTNVEIAFMNETRHTIPIVNRITEPDVRHQIVDVFNYLLYNDSMGLTVDGDLYKDESNNWTRGVVFFVTTTSTLTGNWSQLDGAHFLPIFLNTTVNEELVRIADGSRGKVYTFWGDEFDLEADLDAAFFDSSHFWNSNQITQIASRIFRSTKHFVESFFVDKEIGDTLRLFVSMPNGSSLVDGVSIVSPSSVYNNRNVVEYDTSARRFLFFNLTDIEPGLWSFRLRREGNESESDAVLFTAFIVTPKFSPTKTVLASLDIKTVKSDQLGNIVAPRLTVTIGDFEAAPSSINVTATVFPPGSKRGIAKILLDNGIGADVIEGDCVFSTFLTNIVSSGVYKVSVAVYGGDYLSCLIGQDQDCFQRSPSSLYFDVKQYRNQTDVMPPSAIKDLSLVSVRYLSSNETVVTLRWSAPGDDYDDGTASGYVLQYFNDWSKARNFSGGKNVTDEMIVYGKLSPLPSKSRQILSVKFSNHLQDAIFIAIKTYDDANNVANTSNVVGVLLSQRTVDTTTTVSSVTVTSTASLSKGTTPDKIETTPASKTMEPPGTMTTVPTKDNSTESSPPSKDDPPSHAYDGVIASIVLLSIALVVTAAFCIHMRYFSKSARDQRNFSYEEFNVGERIASRIER